MESVNRRSILVLPKPIGRITVKRGHCYKYKPLRAIFRDSKNSTKGTLLLGKMEVVGHYFGHVVVFVWSVQNHGIQLPLQITSIHI